MPVPLTVRVAGAAVECGSAGCNARSTPLCPHQHSSQVGSRWAPWSSPSLARSRRRSRPLRVPPTNWDGWRCCIVCTCHLLYTEMPCTAGGADALPTQHLGSDAVPASHLGHRAGRHSTGAIPDHRLHVLCWNIGHDTLLRWRIS